MKIFNDGTFFFDFQTVPTPAPRPGTGAFAGDGGSRVEQSDPPAPPFKEVETSFFNNGGSFFDFQKAPTPAPRRGSGRSLDKDRPEGAHEEPPRRVEAPPSEEEETSFFNDVRSFFDFQRGPTPAPRPGLGRSPGKGRPEGAHARRLTRCRRGPGA
ncbi:hypothetical protein M885DRAFT_209416 [Pelagophyceae sp. CCMP2097]|nr:hypothetical protein M885DRAFT_209416 [Pelagophyceae sp. CCMP2097]